MARGPTAKTERILSSDRPVGSLAEYRERGGLRAYEKALQTDPLETLAAIRQSGLRGRGGAGFPTAIKWRGALESDAERKFICCNAAEGEPGTFKDRYLLRNNPYLVLEGLAIGAQITGAEVAYIGIKAAFTREIEGLERALAELREQTPIDNRIDIVRGPDEYLFGEEKALLEVIEGGLPLPRVFPPYIHGLFGGAYGGQSNPTVVNNVETLAHVPGIVNNGPEWFRSHGTEETPGTMVFTISGDVQRPFVGELPLGPTLRQIITDHAGGVRDGREVKAVFPGVANTAITGDMLDCPTGFDSLKKAGSALGSAGFIVYDDTACMVQAAFNFSHFLYIESCNQCPPCKMGSREITGALTRLVEGTAGANDIDHIWETTTWVENAQRCYLPTSEALVMASIVQSFPDDFTAHVTDRCRLRHDMPIPKITDYSPDQGFAYDETYMRKQADWSYA
jgi:NADH-quinone oxidoreductase subunit F